MRSPLSCSGSRTYNLGLSLGSKHRPIQQLLSNSLHHSSSVKIQFQSPLMACMAHSFKSKGLHRETHLKVHIKNQLEEFRSSKIAEYIPPSPSSVTPSTSLSRHCAFFLSFSSTSAYPGNRRNSPKATREWGGMVGIDMPELPALDTCGAGDISS